MKYLLNMVSEIGKRDHAASLGDSALRRRGLLRIGTLMTASTSASAVSAVSAAGAQAAPIDAAALDAYVPIAEKGAPLGVAGLDVEARVPMSQLPDLSATFAPKSLETSKADLTALDTKLDASAAAAMYVPQDQLQHHGRLCCLRQQQFQRT
jgi:hypothetical protein